MGVVWGVVWVLCPPPPPPTPTEHGSTEHGSPVVPVVLIGALGLLAVLRTRR